MHHYILPVGIIAWRLVGRGAPGRGRVGDLAPGGSVIATNKYMCIYIYIYRERDMYVITWQRLYSL